MCHKEEIANKYREKLYGIDGKGGELKDVPEFIKMFFKSKPKLKSIQSHYQYWNMFKNFFEYVLTNRIIPKDSIKNITEDDIGLIKKSNIDQYLIYCRDDLNNSDGTILKKYNALCSLFSYFVDDEIIERNIMSKVCIDKPKYKPIRFASMEDKDNLIKQLKEMKNEFDRVRNIAVVELLMGSGVRVEELAGLNVDDLHLDEDVPYIYVTRKGGDTDEVPIKLEAKIALEEYLLIRHERVEDGNKHILFLSEKTDPKTGCKARLSENAIRKFVGKYSDGKITPHMFRKGLGMLIVNSENGSYGMAAQQLGQTSEVTTRRWYAKIDRKNISNVLNSI